MNNLLGTAVFLLIIGAIFKFAMTETAIAGLNLSAVGSIFLLVGLVLGIYALVVR